MLGRGRRKATLIPLAAPTPTTDPVCEPDTCATGGCRHNGRDPRDHGVRMLDALVEACRRLQTAEVLPESHGAVPRLTLTMSYAELRDHSGFGTTETGEQLSATALRRICCDAHVIPAVLGTTSEVLDVGRAQRLVTTAIGKPSSPETSTAGSPTAPDRRSCATPTTSSTGSTADRPRSAT